MASILIVDDEQIVIRIARLALERAGHQVVTACSGEEAAQAAAQIECLDLLIADHSVPPDGGCEIAARILLLHPAMKVMHISGWLRTQLEENGSLTPGAAFLSKPFTMVQIQQAVASILQ